jgi:predicted nucleic acid-binding protein
MEATGMSERNKEFLDSAYVIALASETDQFHKQAVRESERLLRDKIELITTEAVLLEIAGALARPPLRTLAIEIIEMLLSSNSVTIVQLTSHLLEESWHLYKSRADKSWSWVDCISFVVMQEFKIQAALTSDQHFEQAGFVALLRR